MIYEVTSGKETRKMEADSAMDAAGMFCISFLGRLLEIKGEEKEQYTTASSALARAALIAQRLERGKSLVEMVGDECDRIEGTE